MGPTARGSRFFFTCRIDALEFSGALTLWFFEQIQSFRAVAGILQEGFFLRKSAPSGIRFPSSNPESAVAEISMRLSMIVALVLGFTAVSAAQSGANWTYEGKTGPLGGGRK